MTETFEIWSQALIRFLMLRGPGPCGCARYRKIMKCRGLPPAFHRLAGAEKSANRGFEGVLEPCSQPSRLPRRGLEADRSLRPSGSHLEDSMENAFEGDIKGCGTTACSIEPVDGPLTVRILVGLGQGPFIAQGVPKLPNHKVWRCSLNIVTNMRSVIPFHKVKPAWPSNYQLLSI